MNDKIKEAEKKGVNGILNTQLNEDLPNYNNSTSEKVFEGKNNTWIVLGRDRPGSVNSGYGGAGVKKSGAIDLVAGRTSAVIKSIDEDGNKVYTDPSISYDAARITISQKTDVDENHYLPGPKTFGKSAIAIKADNIRIIAREGMKFVCNIDKYDSNGDLKIFKYGISLIATDGSDLQSIPKGKNLEKVISDIYTKISQIQIANIYQILNYILQALQLHTHPNSTGGPSGPSIELNSIIPSIAAQIGLLSIENQQQQINNEISKMKFLTPGNIEYINSLYHKVD